MIDAGRRYPDHEMASLIRRVKTAARHRYPGAYARAQRLIYPVLGELRTIRRAGPRLVAQRVLRRREWEMVLPMQRIPRIRLVDVCAGEAAADLGRYVRSLTGSSGRTATYLSPSTWRSSELAPLARVQPACTGLRIAIKSGGVDASVLTDPEPGNKLQDRLWPRHREQILVYNYFFGRGLGPRLFDLVELEDGSGQVWTAYVVEHVAGRSPTVAECEEHVAKIERALRPGAVRLVSWIWKGLDHIDFACPDCNGNLIHDDGASRTVYVDMGHFVPDEYGDHVMRVAVAAREETHFGYTSVFMGGKHLYQRVPGVALPARRDTRVRAAAIMGLLSREGVDPAGKAVFDIGCNLGLMSAYFLHAGARWVHGWDLPPVVARAQDMLLALGCTRFSLTGADLSQREELIGDLPEHVAGIRPEEGIVAFLSTRLQIGWPPALDRLPWRWLIYEGNEAEDVAVTRGHIETFTQPRGNIRVSEIVTFTDGISGERTLALLERGV